MDQFMDHLLSVILKMDIVLIVFQLYSRNKKVQLVKGKFFGARLTDFSKVFDCLSHELLIPKLNA